MSVVYSVWVKQLNVNGLNKSFVSIVNISLSPSINLLCDRSTSSFLRSFQAVRSRASSFNFQYLLVSLHLSSRCSRFLHVFPSLLSFLLFPSIKCLRRPFLHKMWPMQFAFLCFVVCKMFLSSLTLCNTSQFFALSVQLIFSILLQRYISKLFRYF
jgi:hypothetical protein